MRNFEWNVYNSELMVAFSKFVFEKDELFLGCWPGLDIDGSQLM